MAQSDNHLYVVGLDLSLTGTGLADLNIETGEFTNVDTYGTKGKRSDTYGDRRKRLRGMADYIVDWTTAGPYDPAIVAVEGPSIGSRNGSQFDRSGLWWLVVDALAEREIPVLVVPPKSRAKYATGNGNSGKDVVVAHVIEQYARNFPSGNEFPSNDNEADAIALAAMAARFWDYPIDPDLPNTNLSGLDGAVLL
jgi:crossover junction endodeoxyribonuclease RuvC